MKRRTMEDPRVGKQRKVYYRPKQKEKFLAYLSDSGTPIMEILQMERILEVLGKTETELDKDACTFTAEEAAAAFDRFIAFKKNDRFAVCNRIRKYVLWCKKNGEENVSDGFFIFSPDEGIYKETKVANPTELAGDIAKLRAMDPERYGPHFGLCVWMLYAGMSTDQLNNVWSGLIDATELYVSFGEGKEYVLEKESLPDLIAVLEDEPDDRPLLLPEYAYYVRLPSYLYLMLSTDAVGKIDFDFTPQNVRICGLFYRAWKQETFQNGSLDFELLAGEVVRSGIALRAGKEAEEFKCQYERWKCAFGLI